MDSTRANEWTQDTRAEGGVKYIAEDEVVCSPDVIVALQANAPDSSEVVGFAVVLRSSCGRLPSVNVVLAVGCSRRRCE